MTPEEEITLLKANVEHLQHAVGSLITWLAQSSVQPISMNEATLLLNILNGVKR
jgi:hypothetical protein